MAYCEVHLTILQIRKLRVDRDTTGIQLCMGPCKFLPTSWGRPNNLLQTDLAIWLSARARRSRCRVASGEAGQRGRRNGLGARAHTRRPRARAQSTREEAAAASSPSTAAARCPEM